LLRLVALGYTNRQTAESIYVSVRAVESHRAHLQQKLDIKGRADLVRYAATSGFSRRGSRVRSQPQHRSELRRMAPGTRRAHRRLKGGDR
jgi:hypothetical protein